MAESLADFRGRFKAYLWIAISVWISVKFPFFFDEILDQVLKYMYQYIFILCYISKYVRILFYAEILEGGISSEFFRGWFKGFFLHRYNCYEYQKNSNFFLII